MTSVERLLGIVEVGIVTGSATDLQVVVKWEIVREALKLVAQGDLDIDRYVDAALARHLKDPLI